MSPISPTSVRTLSLIVPAYNEASNLPHLFQKAVEIFPKYFKKYEILVIDDGSSDETSKVVEEWGKIHPQIRLLKHAVNQGVGAALRDGIKSSRFDFVFQVPGDNQFDLAETELFIPEMERSDVIQGWRTNLNYPMRRKIVTWIYRSLLRILFGLQLKDPTWVKMLRKEIVQSSRIRSNGFFGEIEILIRAKYAGARFSEVGVHTQKRIHGESTASCWSRILKTFFELVRFKIYLTFNS